MKLSLIGESDRKLRELERRVRSMDFDAFAPYARELARTRDPGSELQAKPVSAQVSNLRDQHGDPDDWGVPAFHGEDFHMSMEEVLSIEDRRPLSELHDYWYDGCGECGGGSLLARAGSSGDPNTHVDPGQSFDLDYEFGGVVVSCIRCGHDVFFVPEGWPRRGHRNSSGDWVWGEARSSRRGLNYLYEAVAITPESKITQILNPFEKHLVSKLNIILEVK